MMRSGVRAALFVPLFIFGCAANYHVPLADFAAPPSDTVQALSLSAAVLITDSMENYTETVQDEADLLGTQYTFPLGQIIKRNAPSALSSVFKRIVITKGEPYPQDTDIIVVPTVENFQLQLVPDGFSREASATISMGIAVYDINGRVVWKQTLHSPATGGSFMGENAMLEATGKAAAKAVATAFLHAGNAMAASPQILALVSPTRPPDTIASAPAAKQGQTISSDVDTPPVLAKRTNPIAYAIVIGIEQYRQHLPKADFAVHDAQTMTRYLTTVMGYPEENIVTLLNDRALKSDFEKYFGKWLGNNVEKDSTVFIYFSGHGAPDPRTGGAYLVPYDGDPTFIAETGYPLKRMYAALEKLPARKIVVALDSCFSGAGGRSVLAKGARPLVMNIQSDMAVSKNMAVLSASSGSQISSTYDEKGHGLFTYFLLKGIKDEDVVDPDGSIKVDELFAYVKPQVERIARKQYNNEQTPQLMGSK